jgi:adenylate cyclase
MEATFGFVDLAGFTALTEAHGDDVAANLAQRFCALVEATLERDGRLVKSIGDAVLVVAPTPTEAVSFVARLLDRAAAEPDFPVLRAGLHHGEAVERNGDVFGTAVNVAARVTSRAAGGQVLATGAVATAARAQNVEVTDLGEFPLRNLRDPVRLFLIGLGGKGDAVVAIDPVCRMRVHRDFGGGRLRFKGTEYYFCSLECAGKFALMPASYAID